MQRLLKEKNALSFDWKRSLFALVISIIADTVDFLGEPILSVPLIGDIPKAFVTGLLFESRINNFTNRRSFRSVFIIVQLDKMSSAVAFS